MSDSKKDKKFAATTHPFLVFFPDLRKKYLEEIGEEESHMESEAFDKIGLFTGPAETDGMKLMKCLEPYRDAFQTVIDTQLSEMVLSVVALHRGLRKVITNEGGESDAPNEIVVPGTDITIVFPSARHDVREVHRRASEYPARLFSRFGSTASIVGRIIAITNLEEPLLSVPKESLEKVLGTSIPDRGVVPLPNIFMEAVEKVLWKSYRVSLRDFIDIAVIIAIVHASRSKRSDDKKVSVGANKIGKIHYTMPRIEDGKIVVEVSIMFQEGGNGPDIKDEFFHHLKTILKCILGVKVEVSEHYGEPIQWHIPTTWTGPEFSA